MTASEPKRSTGDFSLTSAAGPYMTNSIPPLIETLPSGKTIFGLVLACLALQEAIR
jgi:hypothetical protein